MRIKVEIYTFTNTNHMKSALEHYYNKYEVIEFKINNVEFDGKNEFILTIVYKEKSNV